MTSNSSSSSTVSPWRPRAARVTLSNAHFSPSQFLNNASVVVKGPVVIEDIAEFKDAISIKTRDPAPLPNFGDFNHFFEDFSRLHSLSVMSERAQLGKAAFALS